MWPWIVGIFFIAGLFAMGIYVIGIRLPEKHIAEASKFIPNQSPQEISDRIRDVEHASEWRRGVSATILQREGQIMTFKETGPNGTVVYRQTTTVPNSEIINEMASPELPYGGTWTIRISALEGGSNVSIREDGFVKPPLFRFLARFVFGYNGSMNTYLNELAVAHRTG